MKPKGRAGQAGGMGRCFGNVIAEEGGWGPSHWENQLSGREKVGGERERYVSDRIQSTGGNLRVGSFEHHRGGEEYALRGKGQKY